MEKNLIYNTQYIDAYIERNNINKTEFAKRCGIVMKELDNIYNQEDIDIIVVIKIVDVLHITTDTFLFMEKFYPKYKIKKAD